MLYPLNIVYNNNTCYVYECDIFCISTFLFNQTSHKAFCFTLDSLISSCPSNNTALLHYNSKSCFTSGHVMSPPG